ncbi:MAG: LicD family protein [Peptococcaceae bacterium]|nr:LicD family protein [Peptococcaceae bacterium]
MEWNFKNDFEYDWCITALESVKAELLGMKKARWLIYAQKADTFMEACVRFLRFAGLQLQLEFKLVVLVGTEEYDAAVLALPFAEVRNIDLQEEDITAEYCVHLRYTQSPFLLNAEAQAASLQRTEKFWEQIAKPVYRGICISDSDIYNTYRHPFVAAEGEFQQKTSEPGCIFARTVERLVTQIQSSYIILRPGIILGAGLNMKSPVTDLLNQLIQHNTIDEIPVCTKYSLVYVTDFLTALIRTAVTDRANTAYNVCSTGGTASLLKLCELCAELDATFSGLDISLQCAADCRSFALDGAKLASLGWLPLVDLKTMVSMEIAARRSTENSICFTDGYHGKLKTIQSVLFQILCEIDRICKKYSIPYFLAGGTLLGAVRHQGFIPWDDDLDVMMLRQDYEKFLTVVQNELPEQLFLQTPSTEDGNHYLISKIRLSDTVFSSEYLMNFPKLHNGIFVDVIAQDYTANSLLGQKLHLKLSLLARGLVFKKWSGQSAAAKGKEYAVFDLVKGIFSFRALERFQHCVLTLFAKRPGRKYLYDSMGMNISKGAYPARWLSGQVNITFGGQEFPAPVEYDSYLRYLYGEYMQPVPVTQRRNSHGVPWVDLGLYAENSAAFTEQKKAEQEFVHV